MTPLSKQAHQDCLFWLRIALQIGCPPALVRVNDRRFLRVAGARLDWSMALLAAAREGGEMWETTTTVLADLHVDHCMKAEGFGHEEGQ